MMLDTITDCTGERAPTVLVIDDDGATQDLLTLLGSAGYTLLRAASGEAGLAMLDLAPVDLVVLDLRLPASMASPCAYGSGSAPAGSRRSWC